MYFTSISDCKDGASNPPDVRRRAGFTLVELLVVIGIIALLISILMPALSKARNSAMAVTCLSNLRQIGNAAQMYFSNNKGAFPVTYGRNANGTYNLNGNSEFAINALSHAATGVWPDPNFSGFEDPPGSGNWVINNPWGGVVHPMFVCNNGRERIGDAETHPSRVSYGFNNAGQGWARTLPGNKIPGLRMNHVRQPSTKVYAMDWPYQSIAQGFGNSTAWHPWYFVPGAGSNGVGPVTFNPAPYPGYTYYWAIDDLMMGRHGTKPGAGLTVNVLYVDGHAESQTSALMTKYYHLFGTGTNLALAKQNPFNLILE